MELTLIQKIGIYTLSIPLAIFISGFTLMKLSDYAEDGWRNNNRKKKWIVCLFIATMIVLRTTDSIFK